jgi:hypothetical protein
MPITVLPKSWEGFLVEWRSVLLKREIEERYFIKVGKRVINAAKRKK